MPVISVLIMLVGIAIWKGSYDDKHRALDRDDWDRFDIAVKGMHKGQIVLAVGFLLLIISGSLL